MVAADAPHLIVGCGYTGQAMARRLVERGARVIGTSRTEERRPEVLGTGAQFAVFDLDAAEPLPQKRLASITVLVPPPDDAERAAQRIERVVEQAGKSTPVVVVISTAIYGDTRGTITERTHPAPRTERERVWTVMDAAALYMRELGHDVRVVRTPAIYGPGRDYRAKLLTGDAVLVRPAPSISRIHVDDLVSMLIRMTQPGGPPALLACDDLPSPTWRVIAEAARLLDLPMPREITPEQATDELGELGAQMRLSGHSCMSLVRPYLGVRLKYPTYREGLRACLRPALTSA